MPRQAQNKDVSKSPPKATQTRKKTPSKSTKKSPAKVGESQIKNYKMKYELKIISLTALTVFFMLCLYTSAVGSVGLWIQKILFGCFSYVAYAMPLVVFSIVFVRLNPNFRPAKRRITIGTILILLGMLLANAALLYQNDIRGLLLEREAFYGVESMKAIYNQSTSLDGAGVFGEFIAYGFLKAIGVAGTLIVILLCFISGFIIFTKISLTDLWEQKKIQKQQKKLERAGNQEVIEAMIAKEKEAERLKLEALQTEKSLAAVRESVQKKNTSESGHDASDFLAQLDFAKKVSRQKDIKQFDYDQYDKPPTAVQPVQALDPVESIGPLSDQTQYVVDEEAEAIYVEALPDEYFTVESIPFEALVEDQSIPEDIENAQTIDDVKPIKEKTVEEEFTEEEVAKDLEVGSKRVIPEYVMPPLSLLTDPVGVNETEDKTEFYAMAQRLEETLSHFNVEAKVLSVKKGPAITMFEVQLSPGIKVSKIVGLSDDIALNLATSHVRIAPIPGKTAIGIEVPNKTKSMVVMKEVLESELFKTHQSKLAVGLGKDISGNPIIGDLASMPHLLIAGATGSGKSVCVNTIVCSILLNAKPDEVKFLMIDPKVVELSNYNGIPHLILPVVTDPKKAAIALNWAVNEMTRRYKLFAETGCRDMKGYNKKIEGLEEEKLAQIVVIIDELADLMMVAPNQVEDAICRLAQMARAAGIHLIVATQRPSVDVITGLIKANIPSRIAFSVSSAIDSRTIIDMSGAEKLLGKGDMLYYPVGAAKPKRAQGAFMSDEEVETLVSFIKNQTDEVNYNDEILEDTQKMGAPEESVDEFLEDAIEFVIQSEQASASLLQRRFRVGYNRAARLVDCMEERGIIGPARGSKPREVLMSLSELNQLRECDIQENSNAKETFIEMQQEEIEMRDYE